MKANHKTEGAFDQEHSISPIPGSACQLVDFAVRPKTFISFPFTGGISAFAVILPQPFGENFMHPWS